MKKMTERDQYGYINNRGRSKYWGVTVSADHEWILSYHPVDDDTTHTSSSVGFKIKEHDIALIAAKIYDYGSRRKFVERDLKVLSADGKWVYTVRKTNIYREKYTNQAITPDVPAVNLFETVPEASDTMIPALKVADIQKLATGENAYVANISKLILDGNLSDRSTKALIAVLESTMS